MTTTTKRPDGGELKPCPFCGCERIDVYSEDGDDLAANKHVYVAQCWDCCARVSPVIGKSKAIAAWNTRTPTNESPAPQATKKTYIKPLRTIVEIQTAYADQIRDWLNTSPPATPAGVGADEIARIIATKCLDPRAIDSSGKLFWKKSQWREAQQAATAILALLSRNKSQS